MSQRAVGWMFKAGLVVVYPLIAVVLGVSMVVVLICGWFTIPFFHVYRKPGGSLGLSWEKP